MKKFFNILVFFVISISSFSEIRIRINDLSPAVNQNIIFTVEFLNEKKSEYEIKGIDKFKIMSMVSRSNYNSSPDSKIKHFKSDIYTLAPCDIGTASLMVKSISGETSNRIILNVSKERKEIERNFFIETTNYNRDYYFGEKIPFVEKLIIKGNISRYSYISTPALNGFSIKNVTPRDGRGFAIPKRVTVNGKEQIELVFFRSILEADSAGQKLIKTGGISITEVTNDGKEKDPVFLGFKEKKINILPLPKENKPKNFHGIVGELNGIYKWSEEIVNDKKIFLLKLKLFGTVNLDKLEKVVELSDDNYDVKENLILSDEHVLDHIYSAERKYAIAFTPKNIEAETMPPTIKIPYFDPIKKEYNEFVISPNFENIEINGEFHEDNLSFSDYFAESEEPEDKNDMPVITETNNDFVEEKIENKKSDSIKIIEKLIENKKNILLIVLFIVSILEGIYIFKLKNKR